MGKGVGRPVFGQGHGEVPMEVLRRLRSIPRATAFALARQPVRRDDGVAEGFVPRGYPAVLRLLRGDRRGVRDRRDGRDAAAADGRGSRKRSNGSTEIGYARKEKEKTSRREHRRRPGLGRGLARRGQGRGVGRRAEGRVERASDVVRFSSNDKSYRKARKVEKAIAYHVRIYRGTRRIQRSGDDAGAGVVARAGRALPRWLSRRPTKSSISY